MSRCLRHGVLLALAGGALVACNSRPPTESEDTERGEGGNERGGGDGVRFDVDPGDTGRAGVDTECAELSVDFDRETPTVALLIDQSGSMDQRLGGTDRWSAVRDVLFDEDDGIVGQLEDEMRFGLALYTSHNGFENGGTCPEIQSVDTALGNADAIRQAFDAAEPEEDTPTGESIDVLARSLAANPEGGPTVIVLATDGAPDSCATPDPSTDEAADLTVEAAATAHGLGIPTIVISVGADVSDDHLQDVANAGAGVDPASGDEPATFYRALDADELRMQFEEAIHGVRSCVLQLQGKISPGHEAEGVVEVNGTEVPYDDDDGWRTVSDSSIELFGAACEAIKQDQATVSVSFPCGTVSVE